MTSVVEDVPPNSGSQGRTYQGSCHCGRVTLKARLGVVLDCNCSLCRRRGALWHGAADSSLRIVTGKDDLQPYQFNTMVAKHYFCRHCGIHRFIRPELDLSALQVRSFDGEHWEIAAEAFLQGRAK